MIAGLFVSLLCLNFKDMTKVTPIVGIYKITSPSGKVYIGQSWNIKKRWYHYKSDIPDLAQPKLFNSFNKYGAKNHHYEVVHELPKDVTQTILDNYEKLYIDLYISANIDLLNVKEGGRGGRHNQSTKDKISKAQKGIRKSNAGSFKPGRKYIPSLQQREAIRNALKGRPLSQKNKDNLSKANIDKAAPKKKPTGINTRSLSHELERSIGRSKKSGYRVKPVFIAWNKGVPMSEMAKAKLSKSKKGVKPTKEHVEIRAKAVKEWWRKRKEGLLC